VLLFSGGEDSIVVLRLTEKAFRPASFPFPTMHIDTGHNFPDVLEFRDQRITELGEHQIVASVQESIDRGRVGEEPGGGASRNRPQTTTLLDASPSTASTPAVGTPGARRRRPEPRERALSLRDGLGQTVGA
jgi:sulfate adenylyltransferase subunit 2